MDTSIILVAFGFADGNRLVNIECVQEALQVCGILTCRVDANMEMNFVMLLCQLFKSLLQLTVSLMRLAEPKRLDGELTVLPEEGDMVSIACGIKTNADGHNWIGLNHHVLSKAGLKYDDKS